MIDSFVRVNCSWQRPVHGSRRKPKVWKIWWCLSIQTPISRVRVLLPDRTSNSPSNSIVLLRKFPCGSCGLYCLWNVKTLSCFVLHQLSSLIRFDSSHVINSLSILIPTRYKLSAKNRGLYTCNVKTPKIFDQSINLSQAYYYIIN